MQLLALPDESIDIGRAALVLSALVIPETDVAAGLEQLNAIAAEVAKVVGDRTDPDYRIRAMNTVLYRRLGFAYDKTAMNGQKVENYSLWSLLQTHKGNCVSLPILWYAVAERLGYPVYGVSAPQHRFLRYDDGSFRQNIEATSGGGTSSDQRIVRDLEIPEEGIRSGAYMRSMTKRELLADMVADVAEKYLRNNNFGISIELNELAVHADPRSVEAHWNLALANNNLGFALLALDGTSYPPLADADKIEKAKSAAYFLSAQAHARAARDLGAAKPLAGDYWKKVSALTTETNIAVAPPRPQPFDVTQLLRPADARVQVTWQMDPALCNRAAVNPNSCMSLCAFMGRDGPSYPGPVIYPGGPSYSGPSYPNAPVYPRAPNRRRGGGR